MKKIIVFSSIILALILITGCTKVGKYQEGTYYAFDEETQYMVTMYVNEKGVIKSVLFDAIYPTGCATRNVLDDTCKLITKQALGDAYNMKASSKIGKEWYEQVNTFAEKVIKEQGINWVKFKYRVEVDNAYQFTAEQPTGASETDKTYTDSVSGVTIHVDNLHRLISDVLEQAKNE
jgi:hypothetical protein